MANSASDARQSELEIRQQLIQAGAVDVMVSAVPFELNGEAGALVYCTDISDRVRDDRSLADDIERVAAAIRDGVILAAAEAEVGALR